mmetsp:Transcript_64498/g.199999  ORF Transcript_64498/g.199999 Transcript_64498/m.199999 type:complete len:295 (-) Transcript_64498:105-989(-)
MRGDLHKNSCNSHVRSNPVMGRELGLRRRLVQLRVVELVQAVLCEAKQFLRCCVSSHEVFELDIFLFPLVSRLCHGLVQFSDPLLQCFHFFCQRGYSLVCVLDCTFLVLNCSLQLLLLVIGQVKLFLAILFLVVVVVLFFLQDLHHVVAHLDDFVKGALAERFPAAQCKHKEVQARTVRRAGHTLCPSHYFQGARAHQGCARVHLHEAGTCAWECFLEELQCVVVVEDLDGVRDRHEFFCPDLGPLLPLSRFGRAALLELCEELFVLFQPLRRVRLVLLQLHNFDSYLPDSFSL